MIRDEDDGPITRRGAGRAGPGGPEPRPDRDATLPAEPGSGPAEGARARPSPDPVRRPIDAVGRARIGRGLRHHYAEVLALPIPDRLRALLDELAAGSDTEGTR